MKKKTNIIGRSLLYYQCLASTNELVKTLAGEGAQEGTVVVADCQTAGRGRQGSSWLSPAGQGLLMSVLLRPQIKPDQAPKITIMAAVAVVRAVVRVCDLKVGIKWPNDIVYEGKKLAGILTEMNVEKDGVNYIVLGVGTNISTALSELPVEIQDKVTGLQTATGKQISRDTFQEALLEELDEAYGLFCAGAVEDLVKIWREHSVTLGEEIRVEGPGGVFYGRATDIDHSGALLVDKQDGERVRVFSGNVSVRRLDGMYC